MDHENENIAATLDRVLPKPHVLFVDNLQGSPLGSVTHVAVPDGFKLEKVDNEAILSAPRITKACAVLSDPDSFIDYVNRHGTEASVTWCGFNPQTFDLSFNAVIDENNKNQPAWRKHHAKFIPDMSTEWKLWKKFDGKSLTQIEFAEFIEANADDITSSEGSGLPTSLQMLQMATEFQVTEQRVFKSTVRLNSGGFKLTYTADPETGTTDTMQVFDKFAIGIPVFHGGTPWRIPARLKYRLKDGKLSFFFELVRPDRVHQGAAKEMITQIGSGVATPMLMGYCN